MQTVRWTGNVNKGDRSCRIVFTGTPAEPKRFITLGGEGELTDRELAKYSKRHQFTPVDTEAPQDEVQQDEVPSGSPESDIDTDADEQPERKPLSGIRGFGRTTR